MNNNGDRGQSRPAAGRNPLPYNNARQGGSAQNAPRGRSQASAPSAYDEYYDGIFGASYDPQSAPPRSAQAYPAQTTRYAQARSAQTQRQTSVGAAQARQSVSANAPVRQNAESAVRRQASTGIPASPRPQTAQNAAVRTQSAQQYRSVPPQSATRQSSPRHEAPRQSEARSVPARSAASGGRAAAKSAAPRKHSARRSQSKMTVGCVIRRTLLVFFTVLLFAVGVILAVANTLANGPSETARNKAVMSAMQASATKWAPGLFLSDEVVNQIIEDSKVVVTDVKPITDVTGKDGEPTTVISEDRWAKAIDGMIYENVNGKTFKGYVLLIKDPSRVSVAISTKDFSYASRIFEIADQYGAIAAINGGEFPDNGVQTGANPIGLTYSQGECVWDDGLLRTFIGFTSDNKLYVEENTTRAAADAAGIRDAVAFQNGNTLITNDGENITYYYADSNTGVAQRTGIGQLADGTVMFLVTDGRTASSMGATKNDIIDTFADYGAITAGLLDGGSSAMLYYRDWYDKYNVDRDQLDEWQLMGLVNRYKAFTNPRTIPTFFIVK